VFLRALNASGSRWPDAAQVVEADPGDVDGEMSAALLDGSPAVTFAGDDGVFLVRAQDGAGTTFAELQLVQPPGSEDQSDPQLAAVRGVPVIGLRDAVTGRPALLVGTDPFGSAFSGPLLADETDVGDPVLLEVGGSPTLIYGTNTGELHFTSVQ
jgi:hypothetical protein